MSVFIIIGAIVVGLHGLVHLMGLVTYWQLAEIKDLPYKTTLLAGQWDVGETGIHLFGALWLIAAVAFVVAAAGWATDQSWWRAAMVGATVFSLVLTGLDYDVAYAGIAVNVVIFLALVIVPRI